MASLKVTRCHFIIPVEVYYKDVLFLFGYTPQQAADLLNRAVDTEQLQGWILSEPANYKGITFVQDNGAVCILMPTIPSTCDEHGTLVHEIFHAVHGIMENINNPIDLDNSNEPWAHLIGFLTAKALEKLNQYHT